MKNKLNYVCAEFIVFFKGKPRLGYKHREINKNQLIQLENEL